MSGDGVSETTSRDIYKPLKSNSLSKDINVRAKITHVVCQIW